MAISICFNPAPMRIFEADGDFAAGAKGYFYLARTTTPLAVYTDAPLATPHTWPVIADAYGLFAPIYIAKGVEYKVRIEDALGNILYAADGIDNPAESTGGEGGGGGLVITADQLAQTGDFIWRPSILDRTGWVRANGKTISSPIGVGDTANDDCEALFAFLWNGFSNTLCPVTPGGRGLNASADWGAAKSIATLDMRGYGIAGLDDMGASAANLIQKTTTIGITNTSTAATVPSTAGLCAWMFVIATGVPAGTQIASVNSATSITLNAAATATNASAAVRFSMFSDAIVAGAAGGENVHVQLAQEMAAHTHANTASAASAVTDLGHNHPGAFASVTGIPNLPGGSGVSINGNYGVGSNVTGITVATTVTMTNVAAGGGAAANLWTPTRLGTWLIKL